MQNEDGSHFLNQYFDDGGMIRRSTIADGLPASPSKELDALYLAVNTVNDLIKAHPSEYST